VKGGDHTLSRDAFGVGLCDYRQHSVDKRSRRKSMDQFTGPIHHNSYMAVFSVHICPMRNVPHGHTLMSFRHACEYFVE
jgi:hypothetical protein